MPEEDLKPSVELEQGYVYTDADLAAFAEYNAGEIDRTAFSEAQAWMDAELLRDAALDEAYRAMFGEEANVAQRNYTWSREDEEEILKQLVYYEEDGKLIVKIYDEELIEGNTKAELAELEATAAAERKIYDQFMEEWEKEAERQIYEEEILRTSEGQLSLSQEEDLRLEIEAWLSKLAGGTKSYTEQEEYDTAVAESTVTDEEWAEFEQKEQDEERTITEIRLQEEKDRYTALTYDEKLAYNQYQITEIEAGLDAEISESLYNEYLLEMEWALRQLAVDMPNLFRDLANAKVDATYNANYWISEIREKISGLRRLPEEYALKLLEIYESQIRYIEELGYFYKDPLITDIWDKINDAQVSAYEDLENLNSKIMERYALDQFLGAGIEEEEQEIIDINYLDYILSIVALPWMPQLVSLPNLIGTTMEIGEKAWIYVSGDGWKQDIIQLYYTAEEWYQHLSKKIDNYKKWNKAKPDQWAWMPVIINLLDDAQDILITALYLAKPLLKRAPGLLRGPVGWALTANDILNLGTKTMGMVMSPGISKPKAIYGDFSTRMSMTNREKYVKYIKAKGGAKSKMGFVLQGLQASETLTGYGLQLGGIMGGLSDTIWNMADFMWQAIKPYGITTFEERFFNMSEAYDEAVESSQQTVNSLLHTGEKLFHDIDYLAGEVLQFGAGPGATAPMDVGELFGEDRSTMEQKAMRILLQFPQLANIAEFLSDEDIIKIIAAERIAAGVFYDKPGIVDTRRADIISMLPFPTATPINKSSLRALKDSGIRLEDAKPALKREKGYPSIGFAIDEAMANQEGLDRELRKRSDANPNLWGIVYNMWHEAGFETLEKTIGIKESEDLEPGQYILTAAKLGEHNLTLEHPYNDRDLNVWMLGAQREADVSGRDYPKRQDWINSALKNGLKWKNKE